MGGTPSRKITLIGSIVPRASDGTVQKRGEGSWTDIRLPIGDHPGHSLGIRRQTFKSAAGYYLYFKLLRSVRGKPAGHQPHCWNKSRTYSAFALSCGEPTWLGSADRVFSQLLRSAGSSVASNRYSSARWAAESLSGKPNRREGVAAPAVQVMSAATTQTQKPWRRRDYSRFLPSSANVNPGVEA